MDRRSVIQFISDIHLEMRSKGDYAKIIQPIAGANILVLAGDIGKLRPDTLSPFIDYCCARWAHVLYVAGNHEFYDTLQSREIIIEQLRDLTLTRPNLHFMDRNIVTIEGQRFLGCTLWSKPLSSIGLADFNQIKTHQLPISIHTMASWHSEDLQWLTDHICKDDVVITHFMPLSNLDLKGCGHRSIYPISQYDLYFGNIDCWHLFKRQPKLWISGHTHQRFDVGFKAEPDACAVRWVCNPYGYPDEDTGDIKPFTTIDI